MKITDIISISPQNTYQNDFYLHDIVNYFGKKLLAIEPDYTGIIKASQLRRMGKALRMGIGCGLPLMFKYINIDGIIIGTSDGGLEDCLKFLNQIVEYEEGTLTPTNFVQSTPNVTAGQLAILGKNYGHNITHVNKGLAFENALIDAKMLFELKNAKTLLVGGIDEISDYNYNIEFSTGQFKKEDSYSIELIQSQTSGTICGEGANMFVFENNFKTGDICVKDIEIINYPNETEISELISQVIKKNEIEIEKIDAIILGINGDIRTDFWYHNIIASSFKTQTIIAYKNLVGEYPTSSAFALKLAHDIIKTQYIPKQISFRKSQKLIKNILIYNHYRGIQHSLIYVTKTD